MLQPTVAAALWLLAAPAAAAGNCEALRSQIEAKIRAAGVGVFSVTVVDAASRHAGKVVGTCDAGTRILVYRQGPPAAAASGATAAPRRTEKKPRSDAIITECKDGSVVRGGDCRK